VRASSVFSPASLEFLNSRGDVQVSGVYTANGWQRIREALQSPAPWPPEAVVEGWVLDDSSLPPDERALREQARSRYFDDYVQRWMRFLTELRVKTPTDVDTARRELTAFKSDGFYKTLFTQFKVNTIRDDDASVPDAGAWLSRLPWLGKSEVEAGLSAGPSTVEQAFRPIMAFAGEVDAGKAGSSGTPPLDKYLAILDGLKADLGEPGSASKLAQQDLQDHLAQAKTGVGALLDGVQEPPRRALAMLLMPPVMGGVAAGTNEGQRSLSDDWKSIVWTAWDEKLSSHFPFRASAITSPVVFADFAKFFRAEGDGILWGFVKARLATLVEQKGDGSYAPKQGADALAPEALMCLTVAQEITDAFFRPGEDPGLKLSVQADWNATDVTEAKFWVGPKDTALPKAAWSNPLRWLGEDVRVEWKQSGRPTQELGRHSFSLFDLFTHLGGLKPSPGSRAVYSADCPPLTLKLRPEGKDALRSDFFTRLHCPQELRILKR
jgi:type VI secretion system protein ImpL